MRKKFKLDEPTRGSSSEKKQQAPEKVGKDARGALAKEEEKKTTSLAPSLAQGKEEKKKGNRLKEIFSLSSQGMSGRNLYFNQIRNEITMGQQPQPVGANGKPRGLPDYQNAKFSNKRNGLVAGYGANTN